MGKRYSNDLRERVLRYKDDNHTQEETCEVFGISRSTLNLWLKRRRETGSALIEVGPPQRRRRKLDETALKTYIQANPDAYLREIATVFGVSDTAIRKACKRYGITRKKRRRAT